MKLLPVILSLTAGSADVISFLGLGGLFNAHITGNLVILASRIVGNSQAPIGIILSVPIFMAALFLTRLLVRRFEAQGRDSLQPLLLLQLLLLTGFLVICVAAGPRIDPNAALAILGGMLGVSAMAVQNALVQVSLAGTPSTTAMTANVTRFTLDLVDVLFGRDPDTTTAALRRAQATWPPIAGFAVGCGIGAACEGAFAMRALAVPVILALLAFLIGPAARRQLAVGQKNALLGGKARSMR
jgi:uncharacterized membrane protein YoaK (UPF0700 family)